MALVNRKKRELMNDVVDMMMRLANDIENGKINGDDGTFR